MTLGERIKKLRQIAGLTQEELAAAIGYSHKTSISKIENDKLDINQSTVVALARVLNTTPSVIMGWTEIEEAPARPRRLTAPQPETYMLTDDEEHLLDYYRGFNDEGKQEALKRLSEMAQLDRYKKRDEGTNPVFIEHHKTHLLIAGKGGSADVEIADPEGLDEEVEKLKRKHNKK